MKERKLHGDANKETNSKVDDRNRIQSQLSCPICPTHKCENARKRPKKDKYKSKRKGRV